MECMRATLGHSSDMRSAHSRHAFAALDNLIDRHYLITVTTEKASMEKTLAQYLRERNAATEAWVAEDPNNRWAGLYTEDLAHWAEIGVLTMRDFLRYEMETQYSDLHKDAYGFRPRGVNLSEWSYEELAEETDRLCRYMESQAEWEAEREALEMAYLQDEAEKENAARDEMPLPIDYVAANYQEGWL